MRMQRPKSRVHSAFLKRKTRSQLAMTHFKSLARDRAYKPVPGFGGIGGRLRLSAVAQACRLDFLGTLIFEVRRREL